MKKLTLLLALLLIFSLTGCSTEDAKAMEAADALMESGDYAAAMEAYGAIATYRDVSAQIAAAADAMIAAGEYEKAMEMLSELESFQMIATKMDEARQSLHDQQAGFLYGTWKDMNSASVLTMLDDGTGTLSTGGQTYDVSYTYEDGNLTLDNPVTFKLTVREEDGYTHLISDINNMNFITAEAYETIGPKEVAITLENWEQYFELKHVRSLLYDEFDTPNAAAFNYVLYLKDEYVEKLAGGNNGIKDLVFKLEADMNYREITDVTGDNYTVGDISFQSDMDTLTVKIYDQRNNSNIKPSDVKYQSVCGEFNLGWNHIANNHNDAYLYMENGRIIGVQGSLMLLP